MGRVLILSGNILNEGELQKKLQRLNYEVLITSTYLDEIMRDTYNDITNILNFFQVVVLSESIPEEVVDRILPILSEYELPVLRKFEVQIPESLKVKYSKTNVCDWFSMTSPIEIIREKVHGSCQVKKNRVQQRLTKLQYLRKTEAVRFSRHEKAVLEKLYQANGTVVSRSELCFYIWEDGKTQSNLAALSSIITRIRSKLDVLGLEESIITNWGEGYYCSKELLEKITTEDIC